MAATFDMTPILQGLREAERRMLAAATKQADRDGDETLKEAQDLCPVVTGDLRNSGRTEPAVVAGGQITKLIEFTSDHAVYVEENLEANHQTGQAKFLETALRNRAGKFGPSVAEAVRNA